MSKRSRIITLVTLSILIFLCLVLGITYAFMRNSIDNNSFAEISLSSCATITLSDENSINLSNSYPMSRNKALQTTPYTFTVSGLCEGGVLFNVYIASLANNTLEANNIHYIITNNGSKEPLVEGILGDATNGFDDFNDSELKQISAGINGEYGNIYNLYTDSIHFDMKKKYDLYLYVDSSVTSDTMNQTFEAGLAIKAFEYDFATINDVNASNITGDSITLTINATAGQNAIEKYFYSNDAGASYIESTSNKYTFTELDDKTEYDFIVYVKDSAGYKSSEYKTTARTNNYTLPTISASVLETTNTITVSVNATPGDGSIVSYHYSIDNGSNYTTSSSNSYTFSDLTSNTTFYIKVYVTDSNGRTSNVYSTEASTTEYTLADICPDGGNLASCIKAYYTTYNEGTGGLYYHDGIGTYTNANREAGDNSYRYSGANPNNYVCFGSNASRCPVDNLYRIIGVFGDETKLIKYDYANSNLLGTNGNYSTQSRLANDFDNYKGTKTTINQYYFGNNRNTDNKPWDESNLNTVNLNTNYLNNIGSTWSDKIVNHAWQVGGATYENVYGSPVQTTYNYELGANSTNTTYSAKIGLMYASDYGYATSPDSWNIDLGKYNNTTVRNNNWMWMGLFDTTICRYLGSTDMPGYVFFLASDGSVYYNDLVFMMGLPVRPSFYLNSDVELISGIGTQTDPYRIA